MVNSTLLERSGLEVSIESSELIPGHVVDQVKETMDEIANLLAGPLGYTQAEINLELFNLVTKLVRIGKNAAAGGADIAVKLAKDKQGHYMRLVEILTQNKRQDLVRKVEEEKARQREVQQQQQQVAKQAASFRLPWVDSDSIRVPPPSPSSPSHPSSSSLPSPPASTVSGPSSPDKAAALKKRKSFETPTPDERPAKKLTGSTASLSTPPPPLKPRFSHRTFPAKVIKSTLFNRFYRRFPVSSYFQPPNMQSPCDLFNVQHPGGEYCPDRDPYDLFSPRFVQLVESDRVGLCPICIEPVDRGGEGKQVWRLLSSPAYQNHMQLYHGISALTKKPFSPPVSVSLVYEEAQGKKTQIHEGKCHWCNMWIPLQDHQEASTDTKDESTVFVEESLWWTHAARCHFATRIEGETDIFEEDSTYITLKKTPFVQPNEIELKRQVPWKTEVAWKTARQTQGQPQSTTPPKSSKRKPRRSASMHDSDAGYCFKLCQNQGNPMIACEDRECDTEWYHLKCVGLAAPPPGNWYCDKCKARRTATRAERGQRRAGFINPEIIEKAQMLAVRLADKKPGEEVVKI